MSRPILPGSTLGVLGSGQLGRMFAIAARRLGYRVHVLSPDDDTPTGQVADLEVRADYLDLAAIEKFARGVDAVTFEFENVPSETTERAARFASVRPGGQVLHTTQHRLREKTLLAKHGIATAPFAPAGSLKELIAALRHIGTPAVIKTASWGYDGKGQSKIMSPGEATAAWSTIFPSSTTAETLAIVEGFIDFECELSVVGVRGFDGAFAAYGPMRNEHHNHILNISSTPAGVPAQVEREAIEITRSVMDQLDVVGVLCVELFLTRDGSLLVNELAPRPHNSGHLTIDAHVSCQFEQQVRAVCGLPLGSAELLRPAAMVNLLGDCWLHEPPNWPAALAGGDVKLHLYGKTDARPGRKMGHMTVLANSADEAICRAVQARSFLSNSETVERLRQA